MLLVQKSRNVLRALVQAHGSVTLKQRVWDAEFSSGRWRCLESAVGDCVYPFVERYSAAGSILDLGCGTGSTGHELDPASYRDYTGVDISEVALEKARRTTVLMGRSERNRFLRADLAAYVPDKNADVILFKDCLYYVPWRKVKGMLTRYSQHLTARGVFIARFAAIEKYAALIDSIERNFVVIEKQQFDQPTALVLVFKGKHQSR